MHTSPFSTDSVSIPSIQDMSVKFLGRVFDGLLSDRKCNVKLTAKVSESLAKIAKYALKLMFYSRQNR